MKKNVNMAMFHLLKVMVQAQNKTIYPDKNCRNKTKKLTLWLHKIY